MPAARWTENYQKHVDAKTRIDYTYIVSLSQAFIVSADVALTALSAYAAAIPASMHRYPQNHFVFVPTGGDDVSTYDILAHPVIAGARPHRRHA